MKIFAYPIIKRFPIQDFMVSVSFGIGRKLRPIFSFGLGIGPKPKRWFRSYNTFQIVQILVHSHFDLVSSLLVLEATEPGTQMAVEPLNIHFISVHQKR